MTTVTELLQPVEHDLEILLSDMVLTAGKYGVLANRNLVVSQSKLGLLRNIIRRDRRKHEWAIELEVEH